MNKVSIIVPVYNAEKYLERCIQSILGQTYQNIELILVNDGSTDGSLAICKRFADQNDKIKLISKENAGHSEARNTGLDYATGGLISFIDDDDWVKKDCIQHLIDQMNKYGSDIAITTYYVYKEKDHKFVYYTPNNPNKFDGVRKGYEWDALRYKFEAEHGFSFITPWCKLFKRELFKDVRFPHNRKVAEDDRTIWKLFLKANKVSYENIYDYCQRRHKGEMSSPFYFHEPQKLYKFELEVLAALEEHISTLSMLNLNTEPFFDSYCELIQRTIKYSLQFSDYKTYDQLKSKQDLLNKFKH